MGFTQSDSEQPVESFRTVLDVAGVPIYTLDSDGQLTYVNTALVKGAGYDRATLVGEHVSILLCDADVDRCRQAIRELLETGTHSCQMTVQARSAAREPLTADLSISLLPLDSGFQGSVGVVRHLSKQSAEERQSGVLSP